MWREDNPELCQCEEDDGIDEYGRVKVTPGCLMQMRRQLWESRANLGRDDEVSSSVTLPEMIQDYTVPMVVLGSDVINLYPSLDIKKVVREVREAVMETKITWEEVDYLEASRYVALNWSEEECRRSELGRVLPRRRYVTGTRPGMTGAGPTGALRGDQEQWVFPHVKLTSHEKRLLVARVVEIATEAMFTHHYYGFAGQKFQQCEGGPIGLRGTCSIARLVLQVFDRKWMKLVEGAKLAITLYMRYMDDGRKFLHPIRPGWRWIEGSLIFTKRWEEEDTKLGRSLLDITLGVVRESVKGIAEYLEFTFETAEDYDYQPWIQV